MIHDSERHPRIRIRPALLAVGVLVAGAGAGEDEGEHWAYQPIRRPPLPRLERRDDLVQNPIDRFVNARLESESLRPRGEAGRDKRRRDVVRLGSIRSSLLAKWGRIASLSMKTNACVTVGTTGTSAARV